MVFPFPYPTRIYVDPSGKNATTEPAAEETATDIATARCANCSEPRALHTWVCGGCGAELAPGHIAPGLHAYRHHPIGARHTSAAFLICPQEKARRARAGSPWAEDGPWHGDETEDPFWGGEPEEPAPRARRPRQPGRSARTEKALRAVEEAWAFFGNPKSMTEAKAKYRAYVAENHPDKERDPKKKLEATERLKRANAAWSLLQRVEAATNARRT